MREILFRGKRIDNGEWVKGSFCMDATEQLYGYNGADGFIRRYSTEKRKTNMFEVVRDTVGQFTGLTDKNGVRIFERDIVRYNNGVITNDFAVGYSEEWAKFAFYPPNRVFSVFRSNKYEVIGNIHDNPELLEVSGNEM